MFSDNPGKNYVDSIAHVQAVIQPLPLYTPSPLPLFNVVSDKMSFDNTSVTFIFISSCSTLGRGRGENPIVFRYFTRRRAQI